MSITLTTPYTVSIGGVSVEDDTVGACTSYSMDFMGLILTVVFQIGTLTGSPANLNVGPYAQQQGQDITVAVYLGPTTASQTYGQWWLNGALQSTVVPVSTLSPFVTQLLGDRNAAETFVSVSGGLMPGTQVPWTQL